MWNKVRGLRALLATVVALSFVLVAAPPALAQGTQVIVYPASQSIALGGMATVEIRVQNVTNLYGVDLRLSFDKTKLEVQDANPTAPGIQVAPGGFLDPFQGFLQNNTADNTAGTVQYVYTLVGSTAPAATGTGTLISIQFKGIAAGTGNISFTATTLVNSSAAPITHTTTGGSITVVSGPTPTPIPTPVATPTVGPTPPWPPGVGGFTYIVKWGDTLSSISRRFGVPISVLIAANGIVNPNYIRAGQALWIPAPPPSPWPGPITHVVQPGENLFRISLRYGTTVQAIQAANGILNPNYIRAGQVLLIPSGPPLPPCRLWHTVQPGQTLWGIAAMYQVLPWYIITLNNLVNPNLLYVGQVLCIP